MSKKANKNEVAPQGGTDLVSLSTLMPPSLVEPGGSFVACPKTLAWLRNTFLDPQSPLYNVEHDHLNSAEIGVLWTNAPNSRHGKVVVGTAELARPPASLSKWAKARWIYQIEQWFGNAVLDFIVTLYAPYFVAVSEIEQLSGTEHELYHCGQAVDGFGLPKFRKDGRPVFTIRGHDAEEFTGIWKRYGPAAGAGESSNLAAAARLAPEFTAQGIASICGACR